MRYLAFAAAVLLGASTAISAATPMFPLPSGAIDPGHVVLQPGVGEQDYFWINEKYPGTTAMDHYSKLFSKWHLCRGWNEAWSSYVDRTGGKNTFVHQLVRHWTNPSNDMAIVVAAKYDSPGSVYRTTPDNERQYVAVMRYKVPDASKFLVELGVKCEKGT
jgi:hypothetical protein